MYACKPSIILTGMSFSIPLGFVGLVTDTGAENQSHLSVIRSILDHNTSREMCLLVENCSGHDILVKPNEPLARVCFQPSDGVQCAKALAYPTDSKEREQKARQAAKDAGIEVTVKKKKQFVENHFDDCGDE